MTLSRRHALLLLAALPAACTSPNPALYTLAPVSGPTHPVAPHLVEIRAVALPHYLERSEIVRSTEGYRLDVLPNDWWAESLSSMLNRVLIQDLSQRLPNSTVYSDTGAISELPNATVAVDVQRFDIDRTGALLLQAEVTVKLRHTVARRINLSTPVPAAGTPALVRAMSEAVGRLADTLADMLAG
jgi:hypothetical protein